MTLSCKLENIYMKESCDPTRRETLPNETRRVGPRDSFIYIFSSLQESHLRFAPIYVELIRSSISKLKIKIPSCCSSVKTCDAEVLRRNSEGTAGTERDAAST